MSKLPQNNVKLSENKTRHEDDLESIENTDFFKNGPMKCLMQTFILSSPDKGTKSAMLLLFGEPEGGLSGKFYHKSGQLRMLDRYWHPRAKANTRLLNNMEIWAYSIKFIRFVTQQGDQNMSLAYD